MKDDEIENEIKNLLSKKDFKKLNISKVSDWLVKNEKVIGIDISNFKHQITTDFIKHVLKNHSDEKAEKARGNVPLKQDDFIHIKDIFENPNLVVYGLRRKNEDMIVYTKKLDDGTSVYFEEILSSKKNQALRSKTMYKLNGEITEKKLSLILKSNKQNDCSKIIIALGEAAISSVYHSKQNDVGSQLQRPTGYRTTIKQQTEIVKQEKTSLQITRNNEMENEEALKDLYTQAEAVELMQQKAAKNAELDENGNVVYPKKENSVTIQEEFLSKKIQDVINSENLKSENKISNQVGYVSDDFADLASQYGYDIKNYKHTVDNFFINHAKKNHGNNTAEENRGNIAITEDDIKNIPSIYNHPDYIIFGTKTKTGNQAIVYVKNIGNATVFVEDVRKGKKELAAQTLYKRARTFDDLTKDKAAELYVHNDPDSITIVDTKKEFVNKKDWALLSATEPVKSESTTQQLPQGMHSLKNAMEIVKAREEVFDNEVNKESTEEKKDVNKKEKVDIVKKGALDFLNAVKNGTAPFLNKSNEDIGIITIKPPLVLNSNTGLPFSGSSQLLAQIYYEKQKMEGEIVTSFAGAKNAGTEIVKNEVAKKNFVLSDTSLLSEENKVLKTRYFMPEACREPEKIYAYTLSKQRPQKINEYRDLIRHFENIPNGQKEIADFRIKIAEEHLKDLRVKFSSKEEQDLSLEQISERKDFIKNYFEKLPEKVRDIEKSVFENTFGISIDIEKDYSGKNIPEKTKKQMEQKLSDFIVKNSMSENKLASLSKDEYKEQLKNQKEMGNNVEIKAVGIKEPEIYLGKYLAACQSNAKFITDEETINAIQKNLEEKLKSNFRFEKYEILKEIGQQAEQISKETTKTLSFEKAHSNKKTNNQVIAKAQKIAPIGMGK